MKNTKRSLLFSVLALILCCAMLAGTTLAWFTDSASSGVNKIQAGNLDIEVSHKRANGTTEKIDNATNLFLNKDGEEMKWEPGAVATEIFTVENKGSLALKYNLKLNITDYNAVQGTNKTLKEVLKVKVLEGDRVNPNITRENVANLDWSNADSTLDVFQVNGNALYPEGVNGQKNEEQFQVVVYWQPGPNDNDWNVNNGKTTTDGKDHLFIQFGVNVAATQLQYENDSFGSDYDKDTVVPGLPISVNKTYTSDPVRVEKTENGYTYSSGDVQIKNASAAAPGIVPEAAVQGVINKFTTQKANEIKAGTPISVEFEQTIAIDETKTTESSVTYEIGFKTYVSYTKNDDTPVEKEEFAQGELSRAALAPVEVGKGLTDVKVKHNDDTEFMAKLDSNQDDLNRNPSTLDRDTKEGTYYDPATGILNIWTKKNSPFHIFFKYDGEAFIDGTLYETLADAVKAANSGQTVTLLKDCTEDVVIPAGKTLTLNLNGKKLTNKTGDTITVPLTSKLTINGNGTVDNVTHARAAIVNNGTVTLNGGAYTRSKEASTSTTNSGKNSYYNILNHGQMTISSGVSVTSTGSFSSLIDNGYFSYTDQNPRSGYVEGTNQAAPSLTINGGTFSGGINTVKNDDNATLTINDGTFGNVTQAVVQNNNIAKITGGTFNAANCNALENKNYSGSFNKGELNISGGTFSGKLYTYGEATWNITGGTFSADPSRYLAEGYQSYNDNGMYSVIKADLIISTAEELRSFANSVNVENKSYSGKTVVLVSDIDLNNEPWTPIGGVVSYPSVTFAGTFDGQNHTIKNLNASDNTPNYAAAGLFGSITGKVQNLTLENVIVTSSHYAGAVVGFSSANVGMEISNCHVKNAEITTTPELVNGSYDNGDKAGGIIGYCVSGDKVTGCTVENATITGYRDLGGIAGCAAATVSKCTVSNVTVTVDNEQNYKNFTSAKSHNVDDIIGRKETGYSITDCNGTVTKNLPSYSTEA